MEIQDNAGLTALHHAVLSGFEDVVDELISAGADVNAVSLDGATAICFAAVKGRRNIFKTLLERRAKPIAGKDFGSIVHAACCGGDTVILGNVTTRRWRS